MNEKTTLRKAFDEFLDKENLDDHDKEYLLAILARDFLVRTGAELEIRDEEGSRIGQLLPANQMEIFEQSQMIVDLEFPKGTSLYKIAERHNLVGKRPPPD